MRVFVDAGGWLSILIEKDRYHAIGSRYFADLLSLQALLITTDYILDEVITRIRYDVSHPLAVQFIHLIREAEANGVLRIHAIEERVWKRAEEIFSQYKDAKLSFTDCTSFALLAVQPVDEVFGYDAHFEMMGHILRPR